MALSSKKFTERKKKSPSPYDLSCWWDVKLQSTNQQKNKNSVEVDIAPASGKVNGMKYRSRAAGQGACLESMSMTITMQGFTLAAINDAEKTNFEVTLK